MPLPPKASDGSAPCTAQALTAAPPEIDLQADLDGAHFLVLRNHGLLTVGPSIADAFLAMYVFEATCQIQLAAQAGGELTLLAPVILGSVAEGSRTQTEGMGGAFVWPALLRKLDRLDCSYLS